LASPRATGFAQLFFLHQAQSAVVSGYDVRRIQTLLRSEIPFVYLLQKKKMIMETGYPACRAVICVALCFAVREIFPPAKNAILQESPRKFVPHP